MQAAGSVGTYRVELDQELLMGQKKTQQFSTTSLHQIMEFYFFLTEQITLLQRQLLEEEKKCASEAP